jgi:hypothetical protein
MLAGYLAFMIESIGDCYACARISEATVPTGRMTSRGLGAVLDTEPIHDYEDDKI